MSEKELTTESLYPDEIEVGISAAELSTQKGGLKKRNVESASSKQRSARIGIDGVVGAVVEASEKIVGKKKRPMLTSSQLSDLFTRLDKNGDGELDLDEFTGIIKMLKIKVTPDYISRVFRSVDQAGSSSEVAGTLDMQEFIAAYQKIYCGASIDDLAAADSQRQSFVRATRYGCSAEGNYVFECYTIPSEGTPEKFVMKDLPNENSVLGGGPKISKDPLDMLGETKGEPWLVEGVPGTVDHIYKMIRRDGLKNKTQQASMMWWVDVAYTLVDRTTAEELVSRFGLPNNSKFLASFGNFGNGLPADPKSRVFPGIGNHTTGTVHSLSYFAQSLYCKQVPVVHHLPAWIKSWQCTTACTSPTLSRFLDGLIKYYSTRFAWMANLSALSSTAADEKISAYERAEGLATLLKTSDSEAYDDEDENSDNGDATHSMPEDVDFSRSTIFSSRGSGVPLRRRTGYDYPPTWLRSHSQIYSAPAHLRIDTMGLHILDQGYGPNALLTVRQIDPEKQQKRFTLEQQSRTGVLGRIISGVWVKLAEVTVRGRGTGVAGELTDSPASLVTFLLMLTHNFSMNSCASLDYWLNVLEKEIKDIVVSKHSLHLSEVERILKEYNSYLDPIESIMQNFSREQETYAQELVAQIPSMDAEPQPSAASQLFRTVSGMAPAPKRRKSIAVTATSSLTEPLPENIEKFSLSFATIHSFFGADPYREIRASLDGYELLDIKGLSYWKERLRKYGAKVESLKELIAAQLDEKRNFMSFMLTIITTLLAPLAILTGYFGMNFDNMKELDHTYYKHAPGVKIMWIICGVCYGVMLLYAFHFRVLYSAT